MTDSSPLPVWADIIAPLLLVALILIGLALATDYRGAATRHATMTIDLMHPSKRDRRVLTLRAWPPLVTRTRAQMIEQQRRVDRFIGVGFVIGGTIISVGMVVGLLIHLS